MELVKTSEPGIRVTFHRPDSKFVQTLSLNAEGDMVDVDNQVDWHESHIFVKAAFLLAASRAVRNLRDPLWLHRAPHHPQQLLGEGAV